MTPSEDDVAGSVTVTIQTSLLLGTLGWLVVGLGLIEECAAKYACTATACAPCTTSERWINAGAVTQLVLAGLGLWALARRGRADQRVNLAAHGDALSAVSVLTMIATTWLAHQSY